MATLADIRRAALAMPEAHEVEWYGAPGFNVGKKTFVCRWGRDRQEWIFKLPKPVQELLFEARPEVFQPFRAGAMLWSYVDIAALTRAEAKHYVAQAWSEVAPKKTVRAYLDGR